MNAAVSYARLKETHPGLIRGVVLAITSFLTQVDLFAAQAILPSLTEEFGVDRATMGFAVNASTIGMAAAGLLIVLVAARINRKTGIVACLFALAAPTLGLALTDDIAVFTALRIAQGVLMSSAFALTMAYLAENCTPEEASGALAAYVTGAVASNLVGRLLATGFLTSFGVDGSFIAFACLNLTGAAFVAFALGAAPRKGMDALGFSEILRIWRIHLSNPRLLTAYAVGFLILFVFVGAFTYVNYLLSEPPFALSPVALGLVYFVFAPAMATTPLAGAAAVRIGRRPTYAGAIILSAMGVLATLSPSLPIVLAGLSALSAGLFFAQAVSTGFIGQAATADRTSASGLYLAAYYSGGLVGSIVFGQVYSALGWSGPVLVSLVALAAAGCAGAFLVLSSVSKEEL